MVTRSRKARKTKKLRVLELVHDVLVPPLGAEQFEPEDTWAYQMELDVRMALEQRGHTVEVLGIGDDLEPIKARIESWRPDIVFNIMTDFHGVIAYEAHLVCYLELLKQAYTGCNPRGIMLANDKSMSKKILDWHGIPCPGFAFYPKGARQVKLPAGVRFPVIVKSADQHGSAGISQASIVHDDEQLAARVAFMHDKLGDDIIAEEYIEGRELTVSIVGNDRLSVFPVWELWYDKLPKGNQPIATERVKWDVDYAQSIGINTGRARGLSPAEERKVQAIARNAYRALQLSGYARMDLRMDEAGNVFVIEANVNADLTEIEDFAEAAEAAGYDYGDLLELIIRAGRNYRPAWMDAN
ncbi:MAG: ATP-grasp domain-containing protein [Planctomycetes bacterium]|nr:ATP-grasp domain-containing protein [Planctomycetota bacterium]